MELIFVSHPNSNSIGISLRRAWNFLLVRYNLDRLSVGRWTCQVIKWARTVVVIEEMREKLYCVDLRCLSNRRGGSLVRRKGIYAGKWRIKRDRLRNEYNCCTHCVIINSLPQLLNTKPKHPTHNSSHVEHESIIKEEAMVKLYDITLIKVKDLIL